MTAHPPVTTLAAFKRGTCPGDRIEVVRYDSNPHSVGRVRTILAVTARHLHYDRGWRSNGRPTAGLIAWPKARDVVEVTDTELTYRLTEPETPRDGVFYATLRRLS
jgi:hypothetical protein